MTNLIIAGLALAMDSMHLFTASEAPRSAWPAKRVKPKQGARNPLRGYYSRYTHSLTEMKGHLGYKHPFSEKKRR